MGGGGELPTWPLHIRNKTFSCFLFLSHGHYSRSCCSLIAPAAPPKCHSALIKNLIPPLTASATSYGPWMLILAALLTALLSLGKFADIPSIRTSTFGKGLGLRWRLSSEIKRLLLTKHLTMLSAQQKLYKLHAIARKRDLQNYTNFRIRIRIWNADPAPGAGISTKINNLHQVYFTSKNLTFFDGK
jgi:hypothetical protein